MTKVIYIERALSLIKDGMTLMIGGFMTAGTPETLMDGLVATGVKDLTVICNDTGFPGKGIGKLIATRRIGRLLASHIGTNPETGRQMNSRETEVTLIPQGTLAERIRCGGAGLGGFLTPTGVGTVVAEGKQVMTIDGRDYLLELPLRADVALLKAHKGDRLGNLVYRRSSRNFNPLMAMAADLVIAEVEQVVEVGELDPDEVMTPSVFVHHVVLGGEQAWQQAAKTLCAG